MRTTKVTAPVTPNKERAQAENRREHHDANEGHGSPSRAHKLNASGGRSSKTPGGTFPKKGGHASS
jgi:hypothetical protein